MLKGETYSQFRVRLKQAQLHLNSAVALLDVLEHNPPPTRILEGEVASVMGELKERALDFLRNK